MPRATAILLNDTTHRYHWGCTATSLGLKSLIAERYDLIDTIPIQTTYTLARPPNSLEQFHDPAFFKLHAAENAELYRRIEQADCVFVNGEGTIHDLLRAAVNLMYMAFAARRYLDKPVYVVNHSVYPQSVHAAEAAGAEAFYRGVYAAFDYIAIRETLSKEIVDRLGLAAALSFDCLPLTVGRLVAELPEKKRTLAIAGSALFLPVALPTLVTFVNKMKRVGYAPLVVSGAQAAPAGDEARFVAALRTQETQDWTFFEAGTLEDWMSAIGSAALLVSGRFHHSLTAFSLRTPFVMLNSNTPKMSALATMLGVPEPLRYDDPNLGPMLEHRADHALSHDFGRTVFRDDRVHSFREMARKNLPPD
jgi:polysaccharide pyruvyl transferase WcaK-like protein